VDPGGQWHERLVVWPAPLSTGQDRITSGRLPGHRGYEREPLLGVLCAAGDWRFGYATSAPPTNRRPIRDMIIG
jgi:hypothetical protein